LNPGISYSLKRDEEDKFYESLSSSKDTYSFAIERIDDKKYIGGCGVNEVDWKIVIAASEYFLANHIGHLDMTQKL
jgi:RimJ/RimL family protein N-acetyltransferase